MVTVPSVESSEPSLAVNVMVSHLFTVEASGEGRL